MKVFFGIFVAFLLFALELVLYGKVSTAVYIYSIIVALIAGIYSLYWATRKEDGFKY